LVTADLDLIKPCWDGLNMDLKKKARNVIMLRYIQKLGKIAENSYGSIISNRGSFYSFENRKIAACFHKFGEVF
jgi:hypothetical protein